MNGFKKLIILLFILMFPTAFYSDVSYCRICVWQGTT